MIREGLTYNVTPNVKATISDVSGRLGSTVARHLQCPRLCSPPPQPRRISNEIRVVDYSAIVDSHNHHLTDMCSLKSHIKGKPCNDWRLGISAGPQGYMNHHHILHALRHLATTIHRHQ